MLIVNEHLAVPFVKLARGGSHVGHLRFFYLHWITCLSILLWQIATSCLLSELQIFGHSSETLGLEFRLAVKDLDIRPRIWVWI